MICCCCSSGVFVGPCNPGSGGHAMTVVGYGTLNDIDYWVIPSKTSRKQIKTKLKNKNNFL